MAKFPKQFTAKQLNRQAAKANKDEQTEKAKLKKVRYMLRPRESTYVDVFMHAQG